MRRRGLIGAVAGTMLVALLGAGTSQAALTTTFSNGTLHVTSTVEDEENRASLRFDNDDGPVVEESSPAGVAAGACNVQGGDTILLGDCPGLPSFETILFDLRGGNDGLNIIDPLFLIFLVELRAATGDGRDSLVSYAPLDASMGADGDQAVTVFGHNKLQGGPGDDRLEGGGGDDVVNGGPGNDQIWGGVRDDSEFGVGDGSDRLIGGSGRDRIDAKDRTKDRKLDCGGGNDSLTRDRFDPRAKSC